MRSTGPVHVACQGCERTRWPLAGGSLAGPRLRNPLRLVPLRAQRPGVPDRPHHRRRHLRGRGLDVARPGPRPGERVPYRLRLPQRLLHRRPRRLPRPPRPGARVLLLPLLQLRRPDRGARRRHRSQRLRRPGPAGHPDQVRRRVMERARAGGPDHPPVPHRHRLARAPRQGVLGAQRALERPPPALRGAAQPHGRDELGTRRGLYRRQPRPAQLERAPEAPGQRGVVPAGARRGAGGDGYPRRPARPASTSGASPPSPSCSSSQPASGAWR